MNTVQPPAAVGQQATGSGAGAGVRSPVMRTAKPVPRWALWAVIPWLSASRVRFSTAI